MDTVRRRADSRKTMGCGRMKVECADGFEVVTKDQKELMATVHWHLQHTHQKDVPDAEILKMAKHP
jgi:predicted small metal-binding protein